MRKLLRPFALLSAVALSLAGWSPAAAQQGGTVQGTVVDALTARPLSSAQVFIVGTQLGTLTNAQGRFQILNVPAGAQQVRVEIIGYQAETRPVTVTAGQAATVTFRVTQGAVELEEIVVTGVAGATTQAKLPFVVDKLSAARMPVPAVDAGSALQGKVAGATVVSGSGRPGAQPSVLLRAPTSINSSGRSQEPLYIVDGVILGAGIQDLDSNDIESIEIVKGAAAASLYGSRAANGVIQITTKSGRSIEGNVTRYTIRTEYGGNQLAGEHDIAQNHAWRMTPDKKQFLTSTGQAWDWIEQVKKDSESEFARTSLKGFLNGSSIWNSFQDEVWPGQTYDHVDSFFNPGNFSQTTVSLEGRSGPTNYLASFNSTMEEGVVHGTEGFQRNSFRLNLDHGLRDNLQFSARSFYSRSTSDGQDVSGGGSPLFLLTRMPAIVPLTLRDGNGNYVIRPDHNRENDNPLIQLEQQERSDDRERFLGGANVRFSPVTWFDADANISYDRSNVNRRQYNPKGFRTARQSTTLNNGYVYRDGWLNEALNASATATFRRSFADLHTRTQLRYLFESEHYDYTRASGSTLATEGVSSVTAARDQKYTRSATEDTRSEGYYLITNFDWKDRYILDALVRRDGSSLFGSEERWQTYYRGAAAWRVSEESFWGGLRDFLPEAKLRYSLGTAGGRPRFNAQYETYTVVDGVISPQNLGNTKLKPEFVVEQEAGIDLTGPRGITLGVTYAASEARDQILRVPLPAATGFVQQWQNAGTLESNTWELSLDAPIIDTNSLRWSTRFLFDRTRQTITELNVPAYQYGFNQQALENVFYARAGEPIGRFYGFKFAKGCADLPQGIDCSQFRTNDDGYFVWTGGRDWTEGMGADGKRGTSDDLWGTQGPVIRNVRADWGTPVVAQASPTDANTLMPIGKTMPDFNFSIANNVDWKGFSFYGLVDATQGVNVYNLPRHWSYFERYSQDQDQAGKPETHKKPVGYYDALYRQLGPPNSHFVEDGSFVKLRELSVRYRFGQEALDRLPLLNRTSGVALSLVGRNLYTWTKYTGYDPEVGMNQEVRTTSATSDVGSAAIARFDGFNYPNFRSVTAAVEINF